MWPRLECDNDSARFNLDRRSMYSRWRLDHAIVYVGPVSFRAGVLGTLIYDRTDPDQSRCLKILSTELESDG
jgi:hypothetical protein